MRELFLTTAAAMAFAAGGCIHRPYLTAPRLDRGLVMVLPGIEGRGLLNEAICDGLNDAGVNWGVELRDWTSLLGPLYSLRAEIRNRNEARKIALSLAEYKFSHPDSPIVLVGHSGGGAMAIWIAEAMPPGVDLDGIILLAPAISPGYMLDFALARCRRGIVNFYSHRDWLFLGVGTTVSGTLDGRHGPSAGNVGFAVPPGAQRPKSYDRLFQISWQKSMAAKGNIGVHLTTAARGFVAAYVAPFVLHRQWDGELVAAVLNRRVGEPETLPKVNQWKPLPPPPGTPQTRPAK